MNADPILGYIVCVALLFMFCAGLWMSRRIDDLNKDVLRQRHLLIELGHMFDAHLIDEPAVPAKYFWQFERPRPGQNEVGR